MTMPVAMRLPIPSSQPQEDAAYMPRLTSSPPPPPHTAHLRGWGEDRQDFMAYFYAIHAASIPWNGY